MPRCPLYLRPAIQRRQHQITGSMSDLWGVHGDWVLEIGSGHGHFLTELAARQPEWPHLGVDLLAGRVERARRKQRASKLSLLRFEQADIWDLLAVWPDRCRLRQVWVLFPDPWPKRRHHDRRLLSEPFLYLVRRLMAPDGRLYFRTDDAAYFDWARERVEAHPGWESLTEDFPFERETVFQARAASFQSLVAAPR